VLGQEWSGYAAQLEDDHRRDEVSMNDLYKLVAGGMRHNRGLDS
jgi:fumarate hydratase class II